MSVTISLDPVSPWAEWCLQGADLGACSFSPVAGSGWLRLVASRGREGLRKGLLLLVGFVLKWKLRFKWLHGYFL